MADAAVSQNGQAWSERPLALHGVVSFPNGPTGLFGVELDYAATRNVGLTAGIGAGYLLTGGGWTPRYALGARYRFNLGKTFALGAGAVASTGKWAVTDSRLDDPSPRDDVLELDHAVWGGAQLSLEWRSNVFSAKAFSGFDVLLNRSSASCFRTPYESNEPNEKLDCSQIRSLEPERMFVHVIGVALGYAF